MLRRICLIVAILAGIAVAALNFTQIKTKIVTLQDNLKKETAAHQEFQGKYTKTQKQLDETNKVLRVTIETLKTTTEEKDKMTAEATAQKTRADKLTDDLTKARGERDDASRELSRYTTTGMKPE